MKTLVLLTTDDCHLCEHARGVLAELAAEGLVEWHELNDRSSEGGLLASVAPPLRPVLFDADRRVIAYGRLSARRLRRLVGRELTQAAVSTPDSVDLTDQ